MDIINGKPTGSVRVSFGYMSTSKDANTFLSFVESNFQHSTETSSDDLIDRPSTNFIGRKTDDVIVKECGDVGDGRGLEVETVEKRGREGRWIKVGDKVAIVSSNTTIGELRRQDSERRKRDKRDKREELWEMRKHLVSFSLTPSVYRYCL